jgi:hypothetical protein
MVKAQWNEHPARSLVVSVTFCVIACLGELFSLMLQAIATRYAMLRNEEAVACVRAAFTRADKASASVHFGNMSAKQRFRARWDWRGPVASKTSWAGSAPPIPADKLTAVDAWFDRQSP